MLIWVGIKYILSTANERANLKGTFIKYIIGVALIALCSTIAGSVAKVASSVGNNTAGGIVDKGFELGGLEVNGEKNEDETNTDAQLVFNTLKTLQNQEENILEKQKELDNIYELINMNPEKSLSINMEIYLSYTKISNDISNFKKKVDETVKNGGETGDLLALPIEAIEIINKQNEIYNEFSKALSEETSDTSESTQDTSTSGIRDIDNPPEELFYHFETFE